MFLMEKSNVPIPQPFRLRRNRSATLARLTTDDKNGLREAVPEPGSRVMLKWDKSYGPKLHDPSKAERWYGDVILENGDDLKAIGTSFCALVSKPPTANFKSNVSHDKFKAFSDHHLPRSRITVIPSSNSTQRDLDDMEALSTPSEHTPLAVGSNKKTPL